MGHRKNPVCGGYGYFLELHILQHNENPEDNYIAEGSNNILCSLFLAHRNRNNRIYLQKQ